MAGHHGLYAAPQELGPSRNACFLGRNARKSGLQERFVTTLFPAEALPENPAGSRAKPIQSSRGVLST